MDITAFLRELLFGHDCVILPGFGGFIGNYTPARIDRDSGSFYPPVKQISFNRNLNNNDGLLIGKISTATGVNYGDARTLVENFVADQRRKLDKGEKIVFDHIGTFVNNQEGNVLFEPDRSVNYHLDSYGLESFQCLPLEGYDVRKRIIKHSGKDPVKQASIRKLLWRAAVIIPLLVVILAVPLKNGRIQTSSLNPLVTAELEHNKKALQEVVIDETPQAEEISQPAPDNQPVEIIKPVTTEAVIETSGYFLITGSFKSEENAYQQVDMLKADGFVAEVIKAPNGFYRVSAMICSNLEIALFKKDSLSKKYPQTWVSKKR